MGDGRIELVVNDDNTLGYKLDGADTVFPFSGLSNDKRVVESVYIKTGSTATVSLQTTPKIILLTNYANSSTPSIYNQTFNHVWVLDTLYGKNNSPVLSVDLSNLTMTIKGVWGDPGGNYQYAIWY